MICLNLNHFIVVVTLVIFLCASVPLFVLYKLTDNTKKVSKQKDNKKVYTLTDKLKLPINKDKLDKRQSDFLKYLCDEIDDNLEKYGKVFILDIGSLYEFIYGGALNKQVINFYKRKEFNRLNVLIKLFNSGHKETYEKELYSLINKILNNGIDVVEEI